MMRQPTAAAMGRLREVMRRRPDRSSLEDASATAPSMGGVRLSRQHDSGATVTSDTRNELGGSGGQATPGWLFRAAQAACATTCIAMEAAGRWIAVSELAEQAEQAHWRMLLAANVLTRSSVPLVRIAEDVGYPIETAFGRAFRREYGTPPAAASEPRKPGATPAVRHRRRDEEGVCRRPRC